MDKITLTAMVDEKRRIMIDLPDEIEPGLVELDVVIRHIEDSDPNSEPQTLREKLIAAGLYNPNIRYASPDAKPLSDEERDRIGRQLAGGKTALELIDEEREERF